MNAMCDIIYSPEEIQDAIDEYIDDRKEWEGQ